MSKTETIRARIEPELKYNVEEIFKHLGLTTTEAITLFYKQVELEQGLPFAIKIPNKITQQTFEKTDQNEELVIPENLADMFKKLEIE
jgi:DNA-damage-inducible protein J